MYKSILLVSALSATAGGVWNHSTVDGSESAPTTRTGLETIRDATSPGTGGDDDATTALASSVARYEALTAALQSARRSGKDHFYVPGPARQIERIIDDEYRQYFEVREYSSGVKLEQLVMQDNGTGRVYPGSLLWTKPLADGRLDGPPHLPDRPPVRTVLVTGKPQDGNDIAFEHAGSFFDFLPIAMDKVAKLDATTARLDLSIEVGANMESELLKAGLSADVWFAELDIGHEERKGEEWTHAVVSLNQVYYTMVADPVLGGMFPPAMLSNPAVDKLILRGLEGHGGELGYVRRVEYGRRLILALSTTASEKELRRALSFRASGPGIDISAEVLEILEEISSRTRVKLVLVGGQVNEGLVRAATGDLASFFTSVNEFLLTDGDFQVGTGAVPVSFEVAYVSDNAQFSSFETTTFAGEIPGRRTRREETWSKARGVPVRLTGKTDAKLLEGDWEVHSDDNTGVEIDYSLAVGEDLRGVDLTLTMVVTELESNGRFKRGRTKIETSRVIRVMELDQNDPRTILDVTGHDLTRSHGETLKGTLRGYHSVNRGRVGMLHDLKVEVDGKGGNDKERQNLVATLKGFTVEIDRER